METYKLGDAIFDPKFRHADQATALQAIGGAYLEWVDQIEASRVEKLRRLEVIDRDEAHCERALCLPAADVEGLTKFQLDLEDEEARLERELKEQEEEWKLRNGVEILRDGRSHHLVAFYQGGAEADLRWVRGYIGSSLTAVQVRRQEEPHLEITVIKSRYL